jgi:hypothetical protein
MLEIEVVAEKFKAWASDNGVLSYDPPDEVDAYSGEQITNLTNTTNAATTTSVLQRKKINFVGVNEVLGRIVICTHLTLTGADLDALPKEAGGGFKIQYLKSAPPRVRMPAMGAVSGGTYGIHSGRYTCGSSISVGNVVGAGTLGCLVRNAGGQLFGLTNNHVSGGCGYTEQNLPIIAPGLLDVRPGGCDPFTVGHHFALAPWSPGSPDNVDVSDNLDAALFKILDNQRISSMQRSYYDTPKLVEPPLEQMMVTKVGRTSGQTFGTIVARSVGHEPVMMQVPRFTGQVYFKDVYLIKANGSHDFAQPGDSGSLVIRKEQGKPDAAVGLVFAIAQDKQLTFMLPLHKILTRFNVELVSGHNI